MKIGLFVTATGKYIEFLPKLFKSIEKYFFVGHKVSIVLFTDAETIPHTRINVIENKVEKTPFPFASMNRCKYYAAYVAKNTQKFDYCYAIDADAYFADFVNKSLLFESVAVRHCAFVNIKGTFETNPNSACFIPEDYNGAYLGGGFYGGAEFDFYLTNKMMNQYIEQDQQNGITPIWHDESALNRFFYEHKPQMLLSPSYHFPEWNRDNMANPWVNSLWEKHRDYIKETFNEYPPFKPKIVFVEKGQENKGADYYRS